MRPAVGGLLMLLAVCAGPADAQPAVFERCAACHAGTEATKDLGPNLTGVVGRKAGSREDFRYSRALSRSGITWDEASLDAFLKAPDQFVPGTRMPFEGLVSDAERAAIVQYLMALR
jgi:cytochrome c